jgi:hypothetical protein
MSENYSEAERRLIESRNQSTAAATAPSSVDQLSIPRIDKKPAAKDVDLKGMVTKVNEAATEQQANAPTVFDTIDKDMPLLKYIGGGLGLLGAGYLAHRFLGGDGNTPPDDNNPPNNRSRSPKDRSFGRTEPTFNSAEATQASMTAGEPKFVADPIPVAPKPVTDVVTVPGTPSTTASVIPTTDQPKVVPVPSEARPPMQYGETKYNVPTASPEVAVAPPASVEPVAVAPKPVSELEQLRIEKAKFELEAAKAKEARAAEAHATKLANEVKRVEAKNQTKQGTPTQSIETTMQKQSYENTVSKAVDADMKAAATKKAPPAASVAPPAPSTPPAALAAPAVTSPVVAAPAVPPAATTLTKEQKGMKNYLVSQYGGGPEGEAAYRKTIDILGEVPAYEKGQGGGLSKEANETIKAWRKSNIEGPKVNLTHDMKKVMKGAGGAGILMALPGFAEAAQNKDMAKMSDIFTDFFVLPFAQSREAGMSRREEESTIANKFKEASKLGSPYRSVPPPR